MSGFWNDLFFGLRLLARNRGFTAAAVVSLALGIGANTAIFSIVHGVLLKPFPVEDPGRLVGIETRIAGLDVARDSYPNYEDLRDHCKAFDGLLARSHWPVSVIAGQQPVVVLGHLVSGNYFDVLGVSPYLGRPLQPKDVVDDGESAVAVISYRLWTRDFESDPGIVGRTLRVNQFPFTVVGVGPPGFRGVMTGLAIDVWMPATMSAPVTPVRQSIHSRGSGWLDYVARLAPGVEAEEAQAELDVLASRLSRDHPEDNKGRTFRLVSGTASRFPITEVGQGVTAFLSVVMGLVGIVLTIACANVANLLLVRGVGREREIALRFALGAGRRRVVRQLLTESVTLSAAAGTVGLLIAVWLLEMWQQVEPPVPIPVELEVGLDPAVLWFTLAVSVVTGLAYGMLPALKISGLRLFGVLQSRRNGGASGPQQSRLQTVLVTAQVAAALVLLVMAALFLRTARQTMVTDPGFDVDNQVLASFNLDYGGYSEEEGRSFLARLVERVEELPAVESTALAVLAPVSYHRNSTAIIPDGYQAPGDEQVFSDLNMVSASYFDTLGIKIVRGRGIDERDRRGGEKVAVINETLAHRYWAGRNAIGSSLQVNGERVRIVGVAQDGKYFQLTESPQPYLYMPYEQNYVPFVSLHVRTRNEPTDLIAGIRTTISELDPELPLSQLHTMARHLEMTQYPTTIAGVLVGGFGVLALVLALIGIYSVMAYSVGQRTVEFGIRSALGARQTEILWMVIRRGVRIAVAGVVIGTAVAAALNRALLGIVPLDGVNEPMLFVGVAALLFGAVLIACYVPGRSATKVDPAQALRYE